MTCYEQLNPYDNVCIIRQDIQGPYQYLNEYTTEQLLNVIEQHPDW